MQSFDIDGVILINNKIKGLRPYQEDFIITGRSYEEHEETYKMLQSKGIGNPVIFNPVTFACKTRVTSGIHKGQTLKRLIDAGFPISAHYEDDEIQASEIRKIVDIPVIMVVHNLTEKENIRQEDRS